MSIVGRSEAESYEYDKLNRLKKVTYDTGEVFIYEYDANGNITSVTGPQQEGSGTDTDVPGNNGGNENGNTNGGGNTNQGQTGSGGNPSGTNPPGTNLGGTPSDPSGTQQVPGKDDGQKQETIKMQFVETKKADYTMFLEGEKYKVTSIGEKAFCKKTKLQKDKVTKSNNRKVCKDNRKQSFLW